MDLQEEIKKRIAICEECKGQYLRYRADRKFCSDSCRWRNNRIKKGFQKPKVYQRDLFAA